MSNLYVKKIKTIFFLFLFIWCEINNIIIIIDIKLNWPDKLTRRQNWFGFKKKNKEMIDLT